ncbi:MAG: oligopeptide/dipeptide ABC transporter ATP-binding protein, partial [Microbacterium sp.]
IRYPARRGADLVAAVDRVSFDVAEGETLGLVGESGCGKSSVARSVVGLNKPASGRIEIAGQDVYGSRRPVRTASRVAQMVFQDPAGSFDPRMTIGSLLEEPLLVRGVGRRERERRIRALLDAVGLPTSVVKRHPHELSGGQLQRAGIGRALSVDPRLVVADEPVSALDVSIQVQIVNLLLDLQQERDLTYLFISHDLSVVKHVSDKIVVMYLGRIVEVGRTDDVFARPSHPYTAALLSAAPVPDPLVEKSRERIVLSGDLGTLPAAGASGCAFRSRCWLWPLLGNPERCVEETPAILNGKSGNAAACHFPEEATRRTGDPAAASGARGRMPDA